MTIFISIAAYRDAELVPTVLDCFAKAERPDDLRIGLVWQHSEDENIDEIADDPRLRIMDIDYRDSAGACWARAKAMTLYQGEDYFLQLDSHHRFVPHWDTRLLAMMARTGSAKPVLTTYLPAYDPEKPLGDVADGPTSIDFHSWSRGGVPMLCGARPAPQEDPQQPIPAKFVSGHMLFSLGQFVEEVPYDPEIYFLGEEISLSIRAWTWGYDLFHPPESVMWHFYGRDDRPRHWKDHGDPKSTSVTWQERDKSSKRRVRQLLLGRDGGGRFGAGPVRTVDSYEEYVGLSFAGRMRLAPRPAPELAPRPAPEPVTRPRLHCV